jgi:hypothetical protein
MLVLGAAGVEETEMAHGALLAISGGLIVALPTAVTGLLDWLDIPAGTPAKRVATAHLRDALVPGAAAAPSGAEPVPEERVAP